MTDADAAAPDPAPGRLPWELHPALTAERLRICARLLANARRDALAMASHELGDDAWSVGCRAYAFSRHRLRRTAEAGHHAWLGVLDGSHHFVFLIEDVPVRFYRGPADDPTERTLRRHEIESQQLSLALGERAGTDGLVFRFAVETDERGRVGRVVFLALRGEEATECAWPVPLDNPLPASEEGSRLPAQPRLIADEGRDAPAAPERGPLNGGSRFPLPRPRRSGRPGRRRSGLP
ncbi:hypothetical protein GCM10010964_07320 [Caldovatus sediminis]|uniref:Uncharacterized protein n=1 Tax=Caldovatus sediminis TaxID=2041189 RepID=A0A8J2Z8U7_9PROT|nr:hypothetical protein [Caldovatus sediminis]GGG21666.1 hypothetical protein GCM10010964_07320 [Caldovatus sediminis]